MNIVLDTEFCAHFMGNTHEFDCYVTVETHWELQCIMLFNSWQGDSPPTNQLCKLKQYSYMVYFQACLTLVVHLSSHMIYIKTHGHMTYGNSDQLTSRPNCIYQTL